MQAVKVELTQDEINNLAGLLDVAVKATGLQGARIAVALIEKIERSIQASQQTVQSQYVEVTKD